MENLLDKTSSSVVESVYIDVNMIIYVITALIVLLSIIQIIYRFSEKDKSAIIWIFICFGFPIFIKALLRSNLLLVISEGLFSGDIISSIGSMFLFSFMLLPFYLFVEKAFTFDRNETMEDKKQKTNKS